MKVLLTIALLINLIIVICEMCTLSKIKKKINILKYYTYLQNFLALIISGIFSVYLILALLSNFIIPEFVRGLRYIETCGLVATMIIYVTFILDVDNEKNVISENDFVKGCDPKKANFILHYFCPIISLFSFVFFERSITLTNSIWSVIVMIPSVIYWLIYILLTAFKLWVEPYDFGETKGKNKLGKVFLMIIIPISFVLVSYIIWNIK